MEKEKIKTLSEKEKLDFTECIFEAKELLRAIDRFLKIKTIKATWE